MISQMQPALQLSPPNPTWGTKFEFAATATHFHGMHLLCQAKGRRVCGLYNRASLFECVASSGPLHGGGLGKKSLPDSGLAQDVAGKGRSVHVSLFV